MMYLAGKHTYRTWGIAHGGVVVAFVAVLAFGSVPVSALAQDGALNGVRPDTITISTAGDGTQQGGYALEEGTEYIVPLSILNVDTGAASMAQAYFEDTATVSYKDGRFQVTIKTSEAAGSMIEGISYNGDTLAADEAGTGYTIAADSIDGLTAISIDINAGAPVGRMTRTANLKLDTSSLPKATEDESDSSSSQEGDTGSGDAGSGDSGSSGSAADAAATDGGAGGQAAGSGSDATVSAQQSGAFVAGHTYQVPLTFLKSGSTEVSMAAQYFGSTALVRPSDDGATLDIYFSTNNASEIQEITSAAGYAIEKVSSDTASNTAQYRMTIPYTEGDFSTTVSFGIATMRALTGSGTTVDAVMQLGFSQAQDLGTNAANTVASSQGGAAASSGTTQTGTSASKGTTSTASTAASTTAKTADNAGAHAAIASACALAAGAAAAFARRRVEIE